MDCGTARAPDISSLSTAAPPPRGAARANHVTFHHIRTNEPWCRDHGPIFVTRDEEPRLLVLDWGYNAWGWKYPPFDDDDIVPTKVAEKLGLSVVEPGMVLEGGS